MRSGYYHPDFPGSFSIKSALPVLPPDLSYDDLDVANGQMAGIPMTAHWDQEMPTRSRESSVTLEPTVPVIHSQS